jgi:hypothetical protein
MTEQEWLDCTDPKLMLEFLRGKASERKLRLFAVGCCRRVRGLLTSEKSRKAVEVAERYVDGQTGQSELLAAVRGAEREAASSGGPVIGYDAVAAVIAAADPNTTSVDAALSTAHNAVNAAGGSFLHRRTAFMAERSAQVRLLRCIIGNPFRPVSIQARLLAWSDGNPVRIGQAIYEERAFDRLPILADALLDAGCEDEALTQHCREPGPHVRGCWAIDLILGKE